MRRLVFGLVVSHAAFAGCHTGGSDWMKQPLVPEEEGSGGIPSSTDPAGPQKLGPGAKTIGARPPDKGGDPRAAGGHVLGTWRNTYYDFPREVDHEGDPKGRGPGDVVPLMNASCAPIAKVPRGFYESVCVQGSGALKRGGTVSFAKRDCACAEICPRTEQRICFDALDPAAFPWGRGASGQPIAPLRSVAADLALLPMGTVLYIPELEGAPRAAPSAGSADGCFVVEDRGLRVQGEHVDIFTGHPSQTALLNARVPSNQGVTVIVEAPKCAHLAKR